MQKSKKMKPIAIAASLAFSATAAMAATTPYDLIRPTWPLSELGRESVREFRHDGNEETRRSEYSRNARKL